MGGTSTAPMPKRVLIISDAWGGQINGVVRTYQNIIAALEARNVDVRVIGPEDFRRIALPFYKEIELAILPARPLRRLIEDYAPDAIHIAVEGPRVGRLGAIARRAAFHSPRPSTPILPDILRCACPNF